MALKNLAISFGIGAALSPNFVGQVRKAGSLLDQLKVKTSEIKKTQASIKKFEDLKLIRKETVNEIINSQKELLNLNKRLAEVDKESKNLDSTFNILKEKLTTLTSREKELKSQMEKIRKEMSENKGNNKALREEYKRLSNEAKGVTSELKPLRTQMGEVKKEMANNSKESMNLARQSLNLENKIESLREKQKKSNSEIKETIKTLKEQKISLKDTSNAYEDLEKKAQAYNKALKYYQKAGNIKERAGKISSMGNTPLKVAAVGTAAGGVFLNEAVKAESAFAGVKKQFDFKDEKEEANFKEDLIKIVSEKRIAVSLEELYGMAANAGQSGLNKDEAIGYIEAAADMGMAFNMSREQASEYMFAWRNTFKMNLTQLKELNDQINTLGNSTGASEVKISEFVTRMGNLPTVVGMATNQTAALGATLMEMGMAPEIAATGAKRLLTILNKGMAATGTEKKALDILGLDPEYLAKATQEDPEKALEKVFSRLSKLKEHEQGAVMTMLFGEEGKVAGANIMGSFDRLKRNLNLVKDSTIYSGATSKEAEIQKNTTANQLQVLRTEFDAIKADIGTELLPLLKEGAVYLKAFLEKVLTMMRENPEGFKRLVKTLTYGTVALYGLGGAFKFVGGLMRGYAGIVNLIGLATEKEIGIKLINIFSKGKNGVFSFATSGVKILKTFSSSTIKILGKIGTAGVSTLKTFGTYGLKAASGIGTGLLKIGSVTTAGIAKVGAMGIAALSNPITWIIIGITALVAAGYMLYKNWDKVKEKAGELKSRVGELVDKYWYFLGPLGVILKGGKMLFDNWENIKLKAGELKDKIVELVTDGIANWDAFREKSMNILKIPFNWLEEKIDSIKEKASHMFDGALEIYEEIKNFSPTNILKNGVNWIDSKLNIPKFATGGIVNSPTLAMVGEGGSSETIIPHEKTDKSISLWEQTGKLLGVYENHTTNNSNTSNEKFTINYSPVINASNTEGVEKALLKDKENFYKQFQESMSKYERDRKRRGYGR